MTSIRHNGALVILCGGRSSRLGTDKCLLPFGQERLVDYVLSRYQRLNMPLYVSLRRDQNYDPVSASTIYDCIPEGSSLAGLYSILTETEYEYYLVVAGDMPFVSIPLLEEMISCQSHYDVIVPRTASGYQPLCAVYHRNCLGPISKQLEKGDLTVYHFYPMVLVKEIELSVISRFGKEEVLFFNINSRDDYNRALDMLEAEQNKAGAGRSVLKSAPEKLFVDREK